MATNSCLVLVVMVILNIFCCDYVEACAPGLGQAMPRYPYPTRRYRRESKSNDADNFDLHNLDGGGHYIDDIDEARSMIKDLASRYISLEEFQWIFNSFDKDGDGKVSYDEIIEG